jgi:hypothetical protein
LARKYQIIPKYLCCTYIDFKCMVAITGNVSITGGSISVTPSYLPLPTFVTTTTGFSNNVVNVSWTAPQDGGTWGICGYQITNVPFTTSTTVLNTTSALVVVPNTTTYFKFIVTPYNYVGLGSTATTSTIAAGFAGAAVNANLYNLPVSATLSAVPVVISSSSQNIVITVNSVTNTAPAIPTYATNIFISPGGTTATFFNTNGGVGSCVYNSTATTTFTGLTPATSYTFSSQSYNAIGYATSATLTTSTYSLPTTPGISAATASAPASSSQINVTVNATQNLWSLPTIGVIVTASPGSQVKTFYSSNSNTNVVPSSNSTGVVSFTGLTASTAYTFTARAFNAVGYDSNTTSASASTTIAPGSQLYTYTAPGAFTFVVPTGVTSVSLVAVGGGGKGASHYGPGVIGGDSTFGSPANVNAGGGKSYTLSPAAPYAGPLVSPPGGTVNVGLGGTGGAGGGGPQANSTRGGGGGGGAGGYAGAGGQGGNGLSGTGIGGAGGAGGGGSANVNLGPRAGGGAGGGGVGVLGQGTSGANAPANTSGSTPLGVPGGNGGSGGGAGGNPGFTCGCSGGDGGGYGGGGGGSSTTPVAAPSPPYNTVGGAGGALAYANNISVTPGASIPVQVGVGGGGPTVGNQTGGSGAVRIIWPGNTRSFPSTCAGAP